MPTGRAFSRSREPTRSTPTRRMTSSATPGSRSISQAPVAVGAAEAAIAAGAASWTPTPNPPSCWRERRLGSPRVVASPRDALLASHATLTAQQALGRISAERVAPYPPGIPVLVPGECITQQAIDGCAKRWADDTQVRYVADPSPAHASGGGGELIASCVNWESRGIVFSHLFLLASLLRTSTPSPSDAGW